MNSDSARREPDAGNMNPRDKYPGHIDYVTHLAHNEPDLAVVALDDAVSEPDMPAAATVTRPPPT
jgi:hypothetical protein